MARFPLAATATSTLLAQGGAGTLLLLGSVAAAWFLLSWARRVRRLRRRGVAVPGTLDAAVGSRPKAVRVTFHTREGREVSVLQNLFSPTRIRTREVTVFYDPEDPRRAHAGGVRDSLPCAAYALLAAGLLFFLVGLGLIWLTATLALASG